MSSSYFLLQNIACSCELKTNDRTMVIKESDAKLQHGPTWLINILRFILQTPVSVLTSQTIALQL